MPTKGSFPGPGPRWLVSRARVPAAGAGAGDPAAWGRAPPGVLPSAAAASGLGAAAGWGATAGLAMTALTTGGWTASPGPTAAACAIFLPQTPQKRAPASCSDPQCGHFIATLSP